MSVRRKKKNLEVPVIYSDDGSRRGSGMHTPTEFPVKSPSNLTNTKRLEELINDCDMKSAKSSSRAQNFKTLNVMFSVVIIICGVVVSAQGLLNTQVDYLQVFMGVIISFSKTIVSAFSLRERGLTYKTVSVKFKKLSRKLVNLQILGAGETDINNALIRAYQEFDDLDITLYSGDPVGKKLTPNESPVKEPPPTV